MLVTTLPLAQCKTPNQPFFFWRRACLRKVEQNKAEGPGWVSVPLPVSQFGWDLEMEMCSCG